eukprot:1695147-Pyramimonas_sp.AAC.1
MAARGCYPRRPPAGPGAGRRSLSDAQRSAGKPGALAGRDRPNCQLPWVVSRGTAGHYGRGRARPMAVCWIAFGNAERCSAYDAVPASTNHLR